ncbi:NACHT domain-containing protein [Fusarium keratoplasticum]|nr:NACHT domain-containing protein [Fusarium keratoplasticum]
METTSLHIRQEPSRRSLNNTPMASLFPMPKRADPPKPKDDAPSSSAVTSPADNAQTKKQVNSNLWDEAMGRLSEDDKAWINGNSQQFLDSSGPGVRGIIALVDQKRQECEANRWTTVQVFRTTINLSDLASNAITWLNKFKEVGDTIVQYDPGHAALPWAATRFILQSAISYEEHMAFSLLSVEKTTRIVHRCQIYELLYNCNTINAQVASGLEKALVDLYSSLLHILARVGKFLCKGTARRSLSAVLRPTEGADLLSELEKFENEVNKEASICESKRSAEADSKSQEQIQKLQSLLKLEQPVLRIDENVQKALEKMETEELMRILEWISPLKYYQHHRLVTEARTKGTCYWIAKQPKFYEWRSETSSTTFWLQGFAGTGKTFITSRVIDLVAENLGGQRNHEGFAYFYCNQTEPARRQALSVLRSFIRQLSSLRSFSSHLHSKLKQLYDESELQGGGWTFGLCKEYILDLFNFYPHTTIILDALDECPVEERMLLLNTFDWASRSSSRPVKIFISSRPEGDIRQRLIRLPNLEISAWNNSHDIAEFIKESIYSQDSRAPWTPALAKNEALKEKIARTLIEKSDGKFQWARLQVDQLRIVDNEQDLRTRLGELPEDLKSSYDEIYQRILDRPKYSRIRALRALKWVMGSPKPPFMHELLNAIRIDPDARVIDEPGEVTEEQLLGWCANLLMKDNSSSFSPSVCRPCHLSVVEYLEGRFTEPTAHFFVTMAKLFLLLVPSDDSEEPEGWNWLILSDGSRGPGALTPTEKDLDPIFGRSGLQNVARRDWMVYVQAYDNHSIDFRTAPFNRLAAMVKEFLGTPTESSMPYIRWTRYALNNPYSALRSSTQLVYDSFVDPVSNPLFGVCVYPIFYPLRDWWEPGNVKFNHLAVNRDGESLLTMAAMSGCIPLCGSLIERGIPVNPTNHGKRFGSPLAAAAASGHTHVIEFLVDRGARVDLLLQDGEYGSALAAARNVGVSKLLVNLGADVNLLLEAGSYGSALAAAQWDTKTAQLLIDNRGEVDLLLKAGDYGSALICAAAMKNLEMVQLLIDNRADAKLSVSTGEYGTALIAAATANEEESEISVEIAQLLVKHGADVDYLPSTGTYGSALIASCVPGLGDAIDILLENKAEVNAIAKVGDFGSALIAAACNIRDGNLYLINLLIEKGADVDALVPTGAYGSALVAAATTDVIACRCLVEKGADVRLRVPYGFYGSPLIAAMCSRSDDIVRLLLDKEVEVDQIPDGEKVDFGTALMAGAYWGFLSGVEMLLEAGAQVNLRTKVGRFSTALAAARADLTDEGGVFGEDTWYRDEEREKLRLAVEKLLLNHGATE